MIKTKACTLIIAAMILLSLGALAVKPVEAASLWSETWHSGIYEDYPGYPQNVSATKIIYSSGGPPYYWIKTALVVSIYQYQPWYDDDAVFLRMSLYFDSFAEQGYYPYSAQDAAFLIDKDTSGSNLNDQCMSVITTATPPGFSQGYGLDQYNDLSSVYNNRLFWAIDSLGHAVGLFLEPISIAETLIYGGASYTPGSSDYDDAGWDETQAVIWWFNPGYDFGSQNPIRQYVSNAIRWIQKVDVNPDTYYGVKLRGVIDLPSPNPFGVSYIETPCVKLRIYKSGGNGGCPYVYTWDGENYVCDNNILGMSEVNKGVDAEDSYRLEQPVVPYRSGTRFSVYSFMFREFEDEHSYIDKVRLCTVDHDNGVNVALTPEGNILTYTDPNPPISAIDNHGSDWLNTLLRADDVYYFGVPGDHVRLDFGNLDVSQAAKLVLRGNLEFKKDTCIHVQTLNEIGEWIDTALLRTRNHWSKIIVDLSGYLPNPDGSLKIRLYLSGVHKIDYVGLDTSPQADITTKVTAAFRAIHSTHGNVAHKLWLNDQYYAELCPGEQIELRFIVRNAEQARTFIMYTEGYYETIT